ncbi:HAD family hydrolase [Deinococcus sp.]|uniref:HAD family hydrolase n=1 Tax=Deinococcus sp. TaxID=47478 RepID=UPI0025FF8CBE|nr:HAD family hydrolase [Deinococcus sp.]
MLRAVIFDLDDTLFDDHHSMLGGLEALRCAHPELSGLDQAQLLGDYLAALLALEPDFHAGRLSLEQFRLRRFEALYAQWGVRDVSGEEGFRTFRSGYQAARRAISGAAALLSALRGRGLKVGVLTNFTRPEQEAKLDFCGLSVLVDVLLTTREVPPKPHPQAYLGALAALEVGAHEAVMVGDSWANDVTGPREVGLPSIWFERRGRSVPEPGAAVIRSYTPLNEALKVILNSAAS